MTAKKRKNYWVKSWSSI